MTTPWPISRLRWGRRGCATAAPAAEVRVAAANFDSDAAAKTLSLSLQYLICWSASMVGRFFCDLLPCLLAEVRKAVE